MSGQDAGALRLSAVAALVHLDLEASRAADGGIGLDGEPYSENEAELIASATGAERQLAEALRGPPATARRVTVLSTARVAPSWLFCACVGTG